MTAHQRVRSLIAAQIAALLVASAPPVLPAQETVTRTLRFDGEAPSRAVVIDVPNATITLEGWAGDSARVEFTPAGARTRELPPVSLADGRLVVADRENQESLAVRVRVPRYVDVSVRGSNGGPVQITGVHGDLEIENSNAGIFIDGSRGGVAASTSNGPIVTRVERMPARAPMSFLTSNDSVRLVLPGDIDAELYLETDNGVVRSAFDVAGGRPAAAPVAPGHARTVRGRVGEGGAVVRVRTDNGDIVIERGPAAAPPLPRGRPPG